MDKKRLARALLAQDPDWEYNTLLPVKVRQRRTGQHQSKGEWDWALPDMARSPLQSWTDLMDSMGSGQLSTREGTEEMLPDVLNTMAFPGRVGIAKSLAKTAEKKYNSGYDPAPVAQRKFTDDYPSAAESNEVGSLTSTIDGDPLHGRFVAGRNRRGGDDAPLDGKRIAALALALTGGKVAAEPAARMGKNTVGELRTGRSAAVPQDMLSIHYLDKLAPTDATRVIAHEIGHAVDTGRLLEIGSSIDRRGLDSELRSLFDMLNNPIDRRGGKPARQMAGPESFGYRGGDIGPELIAEAVRAYLVDPNFIKTVAPNVAARIRREVNRVPQLSKIVQFNEASAIPAQMLSDDGQSSGR